MKRSLSSSILIAALVFPTLALLPGCKEAPKKALCSISLVNAARSRTALPPGIACAVYGFEGSGPGGLSVSQTLTAGPAVFELEPGSWAFTVTGYNSESLPVAAGQGGAELVPGEAASLQITLYPVEGEGSLRIEAAIPATADPACVFEGSLAPDSGGETIAISEAAGTKTLQFSALASGYWTVSMRLKKGETVYSGIAEAVRIAAGQTTVLNAGFGYENACASVSFIEDLKTALLPVIAPRALSIGRGFSALYRANVGTGLGGGAFRWFLNGTQSGGGDTLSIPTDTLPSSLRIDLLARTESGDRAGSVTASLEVLPLAELGPYRLYQRIVRPAQDEAGLVPVGFADPRALVEIPSRDILVQAGGADSGLAVFARSSAGQYEFSGSIRNITGLGLEAPSGLAASPDGNWLVAACVSSDSLLLYKFDSGSRLVHAATYANGAGGIGGLDAPRSPLFSSDGAFLYCAGNASDTVAVLSFDSGTGALAQVETIQATGDLEGLLAGPSRMALSPDGSLLAVSCQSGDALILFTRSSVDGKLSFVSGFKNGVDGVDGLDGAEGLAFSPDGVNLYAASNYDDAIAWFSIAGSHASFSGAVFNGEEGIAYLDFPKRCAVSPDGLHLVCVSANSNSVSLFGREGTTGELSFEARILDGVSGAEGFAKPQETIFASGGSDILISSATDLALSVLRLFP